MSKQIKVAVVALGRAGWNIHVNGLKNRPDFQIVAVVDREASRREEAVQELSCEAYEDIESLLAKTDAELVVVATPNTFHEDDAIKVLESGRHCVLEKPIAMTYAGAVRVAEAAKSSGKQLFVHHQHLFGPEYVFMREVVDSGILGDVFEMRLNWVGYSRRNDWQTLKKNGGGHLNNHGPHALTVVVALLESKIKNIAATVKHIKNAGDADDHSHLFIQAENGRTADVFLSTCCALPLPKTIILGSTGTMICPDTTTAKLRYYDGTKVPKLEVIDGPAEGRKYGNSDVLPWQEEERTIALPENAPTFYDNVAGVLLRGETLVVTPESALEVTRAIEWATTGKDPSV
jgi:scyllo-inositol 2-dehydrogenase (NADP+)